MASWDYVSIFVDGVVRLGVRTVVVERRISRPAAGMGVAWSIGECFLVGSEDGVGEGFGQVLGPRTRWSRSGVLAYGSLSTCFQDASLGCEV